VKKAEQEKTAPAQPQTVEEDAFNFEMPLPQRREAAPAPSQPEPKAAPAPVQSPAASDTPEEETFSLEDILSEFGDL
jgi:hypothetical protein